MISRIYSLGALPGTECSPYGTVQHRVHRDEFLGQGCDDRHCDTGGERLGAFSIVSYRHVTVIPQSASAAPAQSFRLQLEAPRCRFDVHPVSSVSVTR